MGWFKNKFSNEIDDLIDQVDNSKKLLSEEIWKDQKLNGLYQLEELDLEIIRKIRMLHRSVKDNPLIYDRITLLCHKLKNDLDILIKLRNLSNNVPSEKIDLAKNILSELQTLLKEEFEEIKLIRGMTRKQAESLGIAVESFYCVVGPDSLKRIMHGEGVWPMDEERANLGIGVYSFDSLESAKRYKEIMRVKLIEKNIKVTLKIVQITFSNFSLKNFETNGKSKDLRLMSDEQREKWLEENSAYGEKNVTKNGRIKKPYLHGYFHVISKRDKGVEHYFRPECLEEAAIELVA